MLSTVLSFPGLWGFAGAFIYAAPNLLACRRDCESQGKKPVDCWLTLAVALLTGMIAAEACTAWLASHLGADGEPARRGVATVLGLVANPLAPALIRLTTARDFLREALSAILRAMGGPRP